MQTIKNRKLYITKRWVYVIFGYYSILFFCGIFFTVYTLVQISPNSKILISALIGSISISISASCIAYIRKLYKSCFNYSSEQESDDQLQLKRLGTIFYFFTRPIFSLLFSILIVVGLKSGMLASTKKVEFDIGFIYITMFLSFYAGFFSGDFIKKLEKNRQKNIDQII